MITLKVGPKEIQSTKILEEIVNSLIANQLELNNKLIELASQIKKGADKVEKSSKKS